MTFSRISTNQDNIAIIWIDDMIDVATWRHAFGIEIQTPNIDRFMSEGVRFKNTYATVPLCAPCRAEIATGLSPFQTGLVDLNRFWRDILPPTEGWQYDLRRAGFRTFTTGKVDSNYKPMPQAYKRVLFHEEPAAKDAGRRENIKTYLKKGPGIAGINHPNDDGSQDHKFYDWWVAQNAIDYLNQADPKKRHLIQLGFKHPHFNLQCPDRFYQYYDPAAITWPTIAAPEDYYGPQNGVAVYDRAYIAAGNWTPEKSGDHAWRNVVRGYFAAISHVDCEIGRFMDALRGSKFGQNTTVILLSDNGFNLGNHDSFHKMSQWDSAAHVPFGIWSPRMETPQEIDMPVSLHNVPKTIMDLAGLPYRRSWKSGQSLLPLIDESFGTYDKTQSPVTSVFGTLSVRPALPELSHFRYFRYPNGEEHVYDLTQDPGETQNLADTAPIDELRTILIDNARILGLDLQPLQSGQAKTIAALDGTVVLKGGVDNNDFWAYGDSAENIQETSDSESDTLWYMGGPDDYVLQAPANVENIRIATVVARHEEDPTKGKQIQVVAHPDTPIHFETSERVMVKVSGSRGEDIMIGPKYAGATFYGGAGDDALIAKSGRRNDVHHFFGGHGNDTLIGGNSSDILDGGTGNDVIYGGNGHNTIYGGTGNDIIQDGERGSVIHTGPGCNRVISAGGDDVIYVGPGDNQITLGPGRAKVIVDYGGVSTIHKWEDTHILDLSAWPRKPQILKQAETQVKLCLGLSYITLHGNLSNFHLNDCHCT